MAASGGRPLQLPPHRHRRREYGAEHRDLSGMARAGVQTLELMKRPPPTDGPGSCCRLLRARSTSCLMTQVIRIREASIEYFCKIFGRLTFPFPPVFKIREFPLLSSSSACRPILGLPTIPTPPCACADLHKGSPLSRGLRGNYLFEHVISVLL